MTPKRRGTTRTAIRIRADGKHASEYRRGFESVHLAVDDGGGLELSLCHSDV